jgi:NTP pyrophosphatase (non-canonical NTP hydrolase)
MTLHDYQKLSKRTLPDLGTYQLNICHMIFGLHGEFNELYSAIDETNLQEEAIDIIWYLSNYCNYTGIDFSKFLPQDFLITKKEKNSFYSYFSLQPVTFKQKIKDKSRMVRIEVAISKLTDLEKKELAYKKKVNEEQRKKLVEEILYAIVDCFHYYNLDFLDSLQKNIDKLKVRYPDKFSEELAENRDLDTERKILEGKMVISDLPGLKDQPIIVSKPALFKENSSKKK